MDATEDLHYEASQAWDLENGVNFVKRLRLVLLLSSGRASPVCFKTCDVLHLSDQAPISSPEVKATFFESETHAQGEGAVAGCKSNVQCAIAV